MTYRSAYALKIPHVKFCLKISVLARKKTYKCKPDISQKERKDYMVVAQKTLVHVGVLTMPEVRTNLSNVLLPFSDEAGDVPTLGRSKTMPLNKPGSPTSQKKSLNALNMERLKNAKDLAEKAIKVCIIFEI